MVGPERRRLAGSEASLELMKLEMASQFESTGQVDFEHWLQALPGSAAEILDFGFALLRSPRLAESRRDEGWVDEDGVAARAVEGACREIEDPLARAERQLGREMAVLRAMPLPPSRGTARPPFKRAAVNAWTVDHLRRGGASANRLAAVKTTYLLECSLGLGLFTEHQRMPFGPYDPTMKYRDAEPIGVKQEWILTSGHEILPGPKMGAVYRFAGNYLRDTDLAERLVDLLATRDQWELETWATVEAVAKDLRASGEEISALNVRAALSRTSVWKPKLRRPNFTLARIEDALMHLRRLQLVDG